MEWRTGWLLSKASENPTYTVSIKRHTADKKGYVDLGQDPRSS